MGINRNFQNFESFRPLKSIKKRYHIRKKDRLVSDSSVYQTIRNLLDMISIRTRIYVQRAYVSIFVRASPVWFRNLPGLGVVLHVGHNILQHLTAGPLLHTGELRRRVAGALAVHDLGADPLPEHGALLEGRLLPEVGLVGAHLVPGDHRHLRRTASDELG